HDHARKCRRRGGAADTRCRLIHLQIERRPGRNHPAAADRIAVEGAVAMLPGSTDVVPRAVNVMLPPPTVIVGLVANAPPSKRPNVEYVIKAAYEVVGMASKGIVVGMAPPRVCDTSKQL